MVLAAMLAGCATEDRVSGVSTETTNGISLTVADRDGRPVARARVTIWDPSGDTALAITSSDGTGHAVVALPPRVVGIQVASADGAEAAWHSLFSVPRDRFAPLRLAVAPVSELAFPEHPRVRLAGTPFQTMSGELHGVPSGNYVVLLDTGAIGQPLGSLHLAPGSSDTFSPPSDSGLLLDDFDDGDADWLFRPLRANASPWTLKQDASGGALLQLPLLPDSPATAAIDSTQAWRGRSLHLRYTSSDTTSCVESRIDFGGPIDLSTLRHVRLRLRGNGTFHLGLDGYLEGSGEFRAQWLGTPDLLWKEHRFDFPSSPAFTSRYKALRLVLQACRGTDLWIDEVRFDGVSPGVFLP